MTKWMINGQYLFDANPDPDDWLTTVDGVLDENRALAEHIPTDYPVRGA